MDFGGRRKGTELTSILCWLPVFVAQAWFSIGNKTHLSFDKLCVFVCLLAAAAIVHTLQKVWRWRQFPFFFFSVVKKQRVKIFETEYFCYYIYRLSVELLRKHA